MRKVFAIAIYDKADISADLYPLSMEKNVCSKIHSHPNNTFYYLYFVLLYSRDTVVTRASVFRRSSAVRRSPGVRPLSARPSVKKHSRKAACEVATNLWNSTYPPYFQITCCCCFSKCDLRSL